MATIKALNASGNVTAQRKEPFTVTEGQTTTCDRVPLGVAITGTTTSPYFEPSNINITYGSYLYVQNWIEADYHCSVNLQEGAENLSLGAASSPLNGLAVYDSKCVMPREVCSFSLAENSGVKGTVKSPVTNYAYLTKFGSVGTGDGEFASGDGPRSIAMDSSGNLYIGDHSNNRVQKFDSSFGFLTRWGGTGTGTGDGQFNWVEQIALDSKGYVYVCDLQNNRIQKFDSVGNFQRKWGRNDCNYGTANGEFYYPIGIVFDSADNMYTCEHFGQRIQKFNSAGVYDKQWGSGGSADGSFGAPRGIGIDAYGNIYVADAYHRVQKFNSAGGFITKWTNAGPGNGQIGASPSVSVDSFNNVFVIDSPNCRILKFDSVGNYITKFGSATAGNDYIGWPDSSIAFTKSGKILVSSGWSCEVKVFEPAP